MAIPYIPFAQERKTTLHSRCKFLCKQFQLCKNSSPTTQPEHLAYIIAMLEFLKFYKKHYPSIYTDLTKHISDAIILTNNHPLNLKQMFNCNQYKLYTSKYAISKNLLPKPQLLYLIGYSLTKLTQIYYAPNRLNKLCVLESLVVVVHQLKLHYSLSKRFKLIMPPYYRYAIGKVFKQQAILKQVQNIVKSNKKGKKYMRILQKRLRIYTQKKKPFK